ncbi:glutathione S-transferase-like [Saccoglossus kowalevskii]|uniref:S-crystallin 4-like n=1 Tax=Saccoglossus kowalevskii TaxID=10224 RepID=A0ABM0GL94_SACKO|nr:PREDICTED: S-crystallin 4-like [Saccoglossus kowalevskii]
MSRYTLHYFDVPARGEAIRLAFYIGGIEYEDRIVSFSDLTEWQLMKQDVLTGKDKDVGKMPFLPWLEKDGKFISQSGAILRYIGRETGLCGANSWETAQVDNISDTIDDLITLGLSKVYHATSEEKPKVALTFFEGDFKNIVGALEKVLSANYGGKKFCVGKKLTYADLMVFVYLNMFDTMVAPHLKGKDPYKTIPLTKSLRDRVGSLPKVKEYYTVRENNNKPNSLT